MRVLFSIVVYDSNDEPVWRGETLTVSQAHKIFNKTIKKIHKGTLKFYSWYKPKTNTKDLYQVLLIRNIYFVSDNFSLPKMKLYKRYSGGEFTWTLIERYYAKLNKEVKEDE